MQATPRWILGVALVFVVATGGCRRDREAPRGDPATTITLPPPRVPESLRASDGEVPRARAAAHGTQNYECQAASSDGGGGFVWKLLGPEAELTDDAGKRIGRHYAGPTWESNDGSQVVGEVKAKAEAPDGKSVPWLLLRAKKTSGAGMFAGVTSVQRVDTQGGAPPATGCDAEHAGARQSAEYRATYYFYGTR